MTAVVCSILVLLPESAWWYCSLPRLQTLNSFSAGFMAMAASTIPLQVAASLKSFPVSVWCEGCQATFHVRLSLMLKRLHDIVSNNAISSRRVQDLFIA